MRVLTKCYETHEMLWSPNFLFRKRIAENGRIRNVAPKLEEAVNFKREMLKTAKKDGGIARFLEHGKLEFSFDIDASVEF